MKTSIVFLLFLFCISHQIFSQDQFNLSNGWVAQAGVGPGNLTNPFLSNNTNYANDGLIIEPTFNIVSSNSAPRFFLALKKYGKRKSVWSITGHSASAVRDLYVRNLTSVEAVGIFPFDPFELDIEQVGEKKYSEIGLEVAHLWRVLTGSKERLFINIGPGVSGNYSQQDFYRYIQENNSIEQTDKSGLSLSLNFAFELNWKFYRNFGLGVEYNWSLINRYFTNNNEFNLDRSDLINASFFEPAYKAGFPQIKLMYFFSGKKE